jgi:hypothetical protein
MYDISYYNPAFNEKITITLVDMPVIAVLTAKKKGFVVAESFSDINK